MYICTSDGRKMGHYNAMPVPFVQFNSFLVACDLLFVPAVSGCDHFFFGHIFSSAGKSFGRSSKISCFLCICCGSILSLVLLLFPCVLNSLSFTTISQNKGKRFKPILKLNHNLYTLDHFHCPAINMAQKNEYYWKLSSGRSQENEML